ncbi:alpha/beta fold hydrolase [Peribacillus sp. NPDC097225]|uniref:alpha/beta fold hydrolase n=1 Tax=Peribacillus sp. NPDC097225 TaxID=3364400 RepID=UPI0037F6ECC2
MVSNIKYDLKGPEGASEILLLHELGGSRSSWQWIDPYLENNFRRIIVDLPGAGESPLVNSVMSLDDVARSLIDLLDDLKIETINLAGVAYGAVVAAYLAANFPERISSVMLIAIGPHISQGVSDYVFNRANQVEKEGMEAVVNYSLESSFPSSFRERFPEIVADYRNIFTSNNPYHYAVCSRAIARAGTILTERIKSIRSRAVVIGGMLDPSFTPEVVGEVGQLLNPPVKPTIMEEAGHFPQIQASEKLANYMIKFFNSRIYI